jgi:hypothetical protein
MRHCIQYYIGIREDCRKTLAPRTDSLAIEPWSTLLNYGSLHHSFIVHAVRNIRVAIQGAEERLKHWTVTSAELYMDPRFAIVGEESQSSQSIV